MFREVKNYQLHWKPQGNSGLIFLIFENGQSESIVPESPMELLALADILRNEKPIYFNTVDKYIITNYEPTGEEEHRSSPVVLNPH